MNAPWGLICLVFAFVLFAIGALPWIADPWPWRLKCISAGLMFLVLSQLIGKA